MAEHLFLPALSETKDVTIPEKGVWANQDSKIILNIANAIEITEKASKKGISSIPDIWARPLMFQSAIKENSKHPLRKRLIDEWRGLLSLLALAKYKKYQLTISPVKLISDQTFVKALKTLAPKGIKLETDQEYYFIDPDLKEPILIIKYKDVAIGSFSPSTLVYTGTDYAKLLSVKATELKDFLIDTDGFLIPPTKDTDKKEIEYIGEWLCELKNRIGKFVNTNDLKAKQTIEAINGLINDWLKEIRIILKKAPDSEIDSEGVKVSEKIEISISEPIKFFEEDKYKLYKFLLCPLIVDETYKKEEKYSDITLKWSRNLTDYKEILIISDKLLAGGNIIWDTKGLKDLGGDSKEAINKYFKEEFGTKIDSESIDFKTKDDKKAGMWIRPELYFLTNSILKVKNNEDFFSGNQNELNPANSFVWPFKKEILNFFSPIEIKENLKPKIVTDASFVKFSFCLPIMGNDFLIEKTYKYKAQNGEPEIIETDVPVIEIFPDYLGENWRRYYLIQSNIENYKIEPFFSIKNIEPQLSVRSINSSIKIAITNITGDKCFPEALEIKQNNKSLGLILLSRNEKKTEFQDKWTIGIDFGTSNTNVYKKMDDGTPVPWSYNFPEFTRNITKSDIEFRNSIFNNFFIPTKKIDLPITTTLKMYNRDENDKKNILNDFFIYFPEDKKYTFPEYVISDIKWDGEIRNTKYFLNNLLFIILIEIAYEKVAHIKIAYSYPKAFSEETKAAFDNAWKSVYENLLIEDKRVLNIKDPNSVEVKVDIKPPTLKASEGIAVGEYFANNLSEKQKANLKIASVCLDVGGGTTDISIWWNAKIVEDFSILLAGRQISDLLQKSKILRKLLFSPEAVSAMENKEGSKFSAILNHVLKVEEKEIQKKLTDLATNEKVKRLRQMIAIEFGALAYYSAMTCFNVGLTKNKNNASLLSTIVESGIGLYWGGNASKIINWIDHGKFDGGIAVKFLNNLFYNCLIDKSLDEKVKVDPKNLQQVQSPKHKSEASGGLVTIDWDNKISNNNENTESNGVFEVDQTSEATDVSNDNAIVIGETIETKEKKFKFYDKASNNDFYENDDTLINFQSIKNLERLKKFIIIINAVGKQQGFFTEDSKVKLDDSDYNTIINNVCSKFLLYQDLKAEKRTLEPIFIMEVKELMKILWERWNKE